MTNQEIIDAVRRDIREPSPITIGDTEITELYTLGADHIWEALIRSDPTLGRERVSLTSNGHVFTIPSTCLQLSGVWDMKTNALDITDATNATPIVITSAAHG
jgi:hypothetical protein